MFDVNFQMIRHAMSTFNLSLELAEALSLPCPESLALRTRRVRTRMRTPDERL